MVLRFKKVEDSDVLFGVFANLTALKALDTTQPQYVNHARAYVEAAGEFVFRKSSSLADNGSTIIAPTVGGGRWLKIADASADNAVKLILEGGSGGVTVTRDKYELIQPDNTVVYGSDLQALMDVAQTGATLNLYANAAISLIHKNAVNINLNGNVLNGIVDSVNSGRFTIDNGIIGYFNFINTSTDVTVDAKVDMTYRGAVGVYEIKVENCKAFFSKPIVLDSTGTFAPRGNCYAIINSGFGTIANSTHTSCISVGSNFSGYFALRNGTLTANAGSLIVINNGQLGGTIDIENFKMHNTSTGNPQTNGQYVPASCILYKGIYPITTVKITNSVFTTSNTLAPPIASSDNNDHTIQVFGDFYYNNPLDALITLSNQASKSLIYSYVDSKAMISKTVSLTGTIDGINTTFTYTSSVLDGTGVIYIDGKYIHSTDYTINYSTKSIVFTTPPVVNAKIVMYGAY